MRALTPAAAVLKGPPSWVNFGPLLYTRAHQDNFTCARWWVPVTNECFRVNHLKNLGREGIYDHNIPMRSKYSFNSFAIAGPEDASADFLVLSDVIITLKKIRKCHMYQQYFFKKNQACTKQISSTEWVKTSEISVWPQWHNPLTSDSLQTWAVTKVTKQVLVINTTKCITSTLLTLHILLLWAGKHRETLKCQKH